MWGGQVNGIGDSIKVVDVCGKALGGASENHWREQWSSAAWNRLNLGS